jgi:hypothetical protein
VNDHQPSRAQQLLRAIRKEIPEALADERPWVVGPLLLVSKFKEEIHAGIIRSMAGSGSVVTAAGRVFAFTMASFILSDPLVLGQIRTIIALGLMFDTLIVRSFMTPSIAALLGRWFWWPVRVRQRPVPQKFGDENTRQLSLRRMGHHQRGAHPHAQQRGRQLRRRAGEADGVLPRGRSQLQPREPRK